MKLNYGEARIIVRVASAFDDGSLNPAQPSVTARQLAAIVYGQHPTNQQVAEVADLLDRLGVFSKGRGANAYRRSGPDLVRLVRELRDEANDVLAQPLTLDPEAGQYMMHRLLAGSE